MRKFALILLLTAMLLCACQARPEPTESRHDPSHRLVEVMYQAPTQMEAGNYLYYRCTDCGELFLDFTGRTPTTLEQITVPAQGGELFALHRHTGERYSMTRLHSFYGHAAQGSAIHGETFFVCNKYGHCWMYDLATGSKLADFPLGSYDASDSPSQNHCNQMMFGPEKFSPADPYPLLYVTTGYSNDHDSTGAYWCKCSVERIRQRSDGSWYAETVQLIEFNDRINIPDDDIDGVLTRMYQNGRFLYTFGNGYDGAAGYEKIGYGWPHFYVDPAPTEATRGKLIVYSTRFRGSEHWEGVAKEQYGIRDHMQDNACIFTEFALPALPASEAAADGYGGTITLYPRDIQDQFTTDFAAYAFQGGTLYGGRLFHSFGDAKQTDKHTNTLCVWDIGRQKLLTRVDLRSSIMAAWEPECCCIYNGELALSSYNMKADNPTVNLYLFGYVEEPEGACLLCGAALE